MGSLESVLDNGAALANEAADDPTVLEGEAWFRGLDREQRQLGELAPKLLALGPPPPCCGESHALISQALGAAATSYVLLESGARDLDVDVLLDGAEGMKEAGRLLEAAEDALPD